MFKYIKFLTHNVCMSYLPLFSYSQPVCHPGVIPIAKSIIDGVQGESLDYDAFCSIFEQDRERGDGKIASAASQRSFRSTDSARSLVVDEKDFQKFMAQYDGEEAY